MNRSRLWIATLVVSSAPLVGSCKPGSQPPGTSDAAAASSSSASGAATQQPGILLPTSPDAAPLAANIPVLAASVEAAVNPKLVTPYAGPVGVVEGTVKVEGDPAPLSDAKFSSACAEAADMYRSLFREGPGRTLADVMVAATEYDGYVPARAPAVKVSIQRCSFDRRTVVVTYGQRIEVFNEDKEAFLPYLVGDTAPAHLVAMPHGDPVKLYPLKVGRYLLADEMKRTWMQADVFALKYATHTVTGLDGRFRIEGIPVGTVKVSAFLPAAELVGSESATVEESKTTTVDFTLKYKYTPPPKPGPKGKGPVVK